MSITNSAENSFIDTAFLPGEKDATWIGLHDKEKEDEFHWSDGTPYNFSVFSKTDMVNGEGANCVFIKNGEWFEHSCSNKRPYICKKRGESENVFPDYSANPVTLCEDTDADADAATDTYRFLEGVNGVKR